MKRIFRKISFPKALGGDRYEWKEVETIFTIPADGLFVIKIEASAKSAKQNHSKDDDDLRIALDGFDFGKYEHHEEMVSWKGFGTSASWDGARIKGGTKIIYFFVELEQGSHSIQFFADETPTIKSVEIFEMKNNAFELSNLKPTEKIKSERKGIPWLSFVFLGSHTKTFSLGVNTKSAKTKNSTDGDNLKVTVNGKIIQNPHASKSHKYKNFYFSGDIKEFDVLTITHEDLSNPLAFENAIELWYDEEPEILNLRVEYFNNEDFLERLKKIVNLKDYVLNRAHLAINSFRISGKVYSASLLEHALEINPLPLIFESDNPITRKVKDDPIYEKILIKLRERIGMGDFDGEIWPEDFKDDKDIQGRINFNSTDLATAIHGIHKIEYRTKPLGNNKFVVEFALFDVYDFSREDVPFFLPDLAAYLKSTTINALDMGEGLGLINNYEIEIRLKETLYVD